MKNNLKKAAIVSYATIFMNICIGIFYTPWLIASIGKSDYGIYVLISAFLSYFLMDFGIGETLARFVAKFRVEKREAEIKPLIDLASTLFIIIDGLIATSLIIVFFFIPNIFKQLSKDEIETFKSVYIIAGIFSVISFPFKSLNGLLLAYDKFVTLKFSDFLTKIFVVFLMIIALQLGYGIYTLILINSSVGLLVIGLKLNALRGMFSFSVVLSLKNKSLLREIFSLSIWATVMGIAQRLLINSAPVLLGIFSGTKAISIFSIGSVIEGYTWTFANALNGFFLTRVSKLDAESNKKGINDLMVKLGRIQLFLCGGLILSFVVLGRDFIELWMGISFHESYFVVLLLIIPGLVTLTQEIALTQMYVKKDLKPRAILFIIASIICILISIILTPKYGAIGAGIGIFVALFICHIVGMNIIYWRRLKLDIPRFFRDTHVKFLPIILLIFGIGYLINFIMPSVSWKFFIIKGVVLSISYLISAWFLYLNKDEKSIFLSKLF